MEQALSVEISVIIPVYNGEPYLQECLDSLLVPSPRHAVEIICVNDGSTDGSSDFLHRYAESHPEVTVIDKPNGGQSSARNLGLKHARGTYVEFVDCDDTLKPGALDTLYERACKDRLDVLYFDGNSFYEDDSLKQDHSAYDTLYQTKVPISGVMSGQELFVKLREGQSYRVSPCLQMIRRAYLEEINATFLEGIHYEDNLFTLTTMLQAARASVYAKPLYRRRIHGGSIMTSHKSYQHVRSYLICFLEMAVFTTRSHFNARVTENVKVQLSSLLTHARQHYALLTTAEKRQASEEDPDNIWMKLLLDKVAEAPSRSFSWRWIIREIYGHMLCKRWFFIASAPFRALLHAVRRMRNRSRGKTLPAIKAFDRRSSEKTAEVRSYRPSEKMAEFCSAPYDSEHPFVSVIIPVYNTAAYLPAALDDLLAQTLKNFEILLVDDGSTDNSVELIEDYMKRDARISLYRQQNAYAGVARNTGMEHAKGDYLLFLDSDDRFDPELLALSYDRARQADAQVVIFDADILQMPQKKLIEVNWLQHTASLPEDVFAARDAADHLFNVLNSWTKLYQRSYIQENGFSFQPLFCINDAHFTMMALACADRIAPLPRRLVHYRIGGGGNIQSKMDRSPLDVYTAFVATRDQLVERGRYEDFAVPFSSKAMESMLRQLDKLHSIEGVKKLYDVLHEEGLERLGLNTLTVEKMHLPRQRSETVLSRCQEIKELPFEQYLLRHIQQP